MNWKWVCGALLAALWVGIQPVLAASPNHAEVDPRVYEDAATSSEVNVLIRLSDPSAPAAAAVPLVNSNQDLRQVMVDDRIRTVGASQGSLRAELEAGGWEYRSFWIVNLIALKADLTEINRLAARLDILYIESDRSFQVPLGSRSTTEIVPAATAGIEPGLTQVHAPDLWALPSAVTGTGITVASADTGVQWDHPALISHYRGWNGSTADHNYNWWDAVHGTGSNICGYDLQAPCDDDTSPYSNGHGTHTTGTMVGDDGAGNQIGMAPGAKWIACRNMDNGVGTPSRYIECLQFFIAPTDLNQNNPDVTKRPDVINNSYACPPTEGCTSISLHDAIQQVRTANIFMSVSAGNNGWAGSCNRISDPPALEPGVFAVGAVDSNDQTASFSSRGPVIYNGVTYLKPDIAAPGVSTYSSERSSSYGYLSGTSMASPHVAGAVALLWSAFPSLRHDVPATERLLRYSATPLPVNETCGGLPVGAVPNNTTGWGLLNVLKAYQLQANPAPWTYFPIISR